MHRPHAERYILHSWMKCRDHCYVIEQYGQIVWHAAAYSGQLSLVPGYDVTVANQPIKSKKVQTSYSKASLNVKKKKKE